MPEIGPWSSRAIKDYSRVIEEFGLEPFDPSQLPDPPIVFRRGLVVASRDFGRILRSIRGKRPFALLTGFSPSGPMHFGHKLVADQVLYYRSLGADVTVAMADIEAFAVRGTPLRESKLLGVKSYILNMMAMGLEDADFYFQSERVAVRDLAWRLGTKVTFSELRSIYGFDESVSYSHLSVPLIQVGDILHVQLPEFGGPRPTIVPVALDQDPHIRLTRDLADRNSLYSVEARGRGLAVFIRGKEDPLPHLERARDALESMGFSEFRMVPSYRALFVEDAPPGMREVVEEELRRLEPEAGYYGFIPPSATYNVHLEGLRGGKMSSSQPESAVFLDDDPEVAARKVWNALTGGRKTAEDQRRYGGDPERCQVFQLMKYHLVQDDAYLRQVEEECRTGQRLCGQCKREAAEAIREFLEGLARRRRELEPEVLSRFGLR